MAWSDDGGPEYQKAKHDRLRQTTVGHQTRGGKGALAQAVERTKKPKPKKGKRR